eukprot:GHVU01081272.1.p1 GENE.GHVU01081272.1~~GHVU01081272.1.p1  ORF type:complete len:242 (+),score=29.20 GHVU01081272.1:18-743(+)
MLTPSIPPPPISYRRRTVRHEETRNKEKNKRRSGASPLPSPSPPPPNGRFSHITQPTAHSIKWTTELPDTLTHDDDDDVHIHRPTDPSIHPPHDHITTISQTARLRARCNTCNTCNTTHTHTHTQASRKTDTTRRVAREAANNHLRTSNANGTKKREMHACMRWMDAQVTAHTYYVVYLRSHIYTHAHTHADTPHIHKNLHLALLPSLPRRPACSPAGEWVGWVQPLGVDKDLRERGERSQ